MAMDEDLLARMRAALEGLDGISEKRMFGGVCFLHDGNMIGGVRRHRDGVGRFMFRIGKENDREALGHDGVEPMIHGARRMPGFIWVHEETCDAAALQGWVAMAHSFVGQLPPKPAAPPKAPKPRGKRPA